MKDFEVKQKGVGGGIRGSQIDESTIELYKKQSSSRAGTRIRRLVLANELKYMWTLTYADEITDIEQVLADFNNFKRNLKLIAIIEKIATTDTPVLILGKNGVGKELVARAIHNGSARANRKMININCGAIPDNLIESELFGHVKGAFTGAILAKTGRIQMADKSTLFLDEVGDLTPSAQAKLLRFLENGEIQKVGSTETHFVDTRIITGTNKNLIKMVEKKEFREDLYYRLEVITICIPPLKERKTDIPLLLDHFMEITAQTYGIIKPHLTPASVKYLTHYDWPGNVRQLKHFIERLLIMTNCDVLDIQHIKSYLNEVKKSTAETDIQSFKEAKRAFERDYLTQTLSQTHGNLSKAANILKMDRGNLSRKMKQLGLQH